MKGRNILKLIFQIIMFVHISCIVKAQLNTPLRRPVSPSSPMWLIHIDTWNYADPQKIIDLVPEDIRPFVVMNISLSISHDVATSRFRVAEYGYEIAKSWLRACAQNRMWAMVQPSSGAYSQFSDFDLSVYEEFYRDYPNMIGFNYCEQSWGYEDDDPLTTTWNNRMYHFTNLLELSDQYGGYLVVSWCGNQWISAINPIAMLKRNPGFASACSLYTKNYILCEKYTFKTYQSDMESLCLGGYLSGYTGQYGIRYDDTGWSDKDGNNNVNFTMATYGAPFLEHVMLTGQTVIDGPELIWKYCFQETNPVTTTDGYSSRNWETFSQFDNVSVDLFRKILDGTVRIPDRQEIIDRTKIVIINNVNSGGNDDQYSSPATLFQGLYRMEGDGNLENNLSFFKKTGRYPTVPTVYQLNDSIANTFQVKVNKSGYLSRWPNISDKINEFNSLFPEEYTGDLYAGRHENGWVTYNPNKADQTAKGFLPFKYNTCDSMELTYSQYTAGVVKEYSDYLTIYLSNYDNMLNSALKKDTIRIYGNSSEPSFAYEDRGNHKASLVTKDWSDGVFTLVVEHNGSIDIAVYCSGTATGRLTDYQTANIAVPNSPPAYMGPRQYEAETFGYKNITGIVKNGYDQNIRNYTGQGYLQFGTNASASIRDYVSVLNEGTYLIETKYTVIGNDINTIDLYVNGSKVVTPVFMQTGSLGDWSVDSQFVELKMGVNTIELRGNASGAQSIYFDNIIIKSDYDDGIWLEAECGALGSLWETVSDSTASNGNFVTVQSGNNSTDTVPVDSSGYITYGFHTDESGTYTVWGHFIAPTIYDDALWVKMDTAAWILRDSITLSTTWNWVEMDTFLLEYGNHTFSVAYGEDGTKLDKIYITPSETIPSGKGGPAGNCLDRNQPPIAYAGSDKIVIDSDGNGSETITLKSTGSVDVDGTIDIYTWTAGDSLIATGSSPTVALALGVHLLTLTVTDNEGVTDTDDMLITIFESGFEYTSIWMEAECATVGKNWDTLENANASNGHYVTAKPGMQSTGQAPSGDGQIPLPFTVSSSDGYSVFARVNCPSYDDDSFWVKMDNGTFQMFNGLKSSGWEWVRFDGYELTKGEHTLTIGYREDGALLDKVLITNYPDMPAGLGNEAINICEIVKDTADKDTSDVSISHMVQTKNSYVLEQNYPNPFSNTTLIRYTLKEPGQVYLKIYTLAGQEIETIVDKYLPAGEHGIVWQAKGLPDGIYFYRLQVGNFIETRKLIMQE